MNKSLYEVFTKFKAW